MGKTLSRLGILALLALSRSGLAQIAGLVQIERLTLDQMVQKTDGAVVGTIAKQKVFKVDHPIDGPDLYYTTLTILGTSMVDGSELALEVTFPGGFIDPEHGVWNSEAPRPEEVAIGNQVVAFYAWTDNMGGDVAANALYASHGGLYQVATSGSKQVVLGRGEGYAVSSNWELAKLDQEVARLAKLAKKN